MEPAIIVAIIIIILIVLATIGIAIYYAVRPSGNTGNTGPGPGLPAFPNLQQGSNLIPPSTAGALIGSSVGMSEDGNTMIVGLPGQSNNTGGAYVYGRSGGIWSLQSGLLVGTGATGAASQGQAVAINTDGTRILVGGPTDGPNHEGAVWIYTKTNGAWSQYGPKLTGSDSTTNALFGSFVDLADESDYFAVGSPGDQSSLGCTHVFQLIGEDWVQMGSKLVGTGSVGSTPRQGFSVQISDLGQALITGSPGDAGGLGACWVFTQTLGVWSQLGDKLTPTGNIGNPQFGYSVAISGTDGSTIAVSGPSNNNSQGAVWIYTVIDGTITQQGSTLIPSGTSGQPLFGFSIDLSNSGSTLIAGAPQNAGNEGMTFSFVRNNLLNWQQVAQLKGTGAIGLAQQGYAVALSADGTTAAIGSRANNSNTGAVWIFIYSI